MQCSNKGDCRSCHHEVTVHLRKYSYQGSGADPGFDQGGAQIVTGLKLPFWGLSFVEFWCWGLIFGGRGGAGPPGPPPWIRPCWLDEFPGRFLAWMLSCCKPPQISQVLYEVVCPSSNFINFNFYFNLQIIQLHSAWQIEDILKRTDIFTEGMYPGELSHFETIKMFDVRLKTFVPNKFEDIKKQLTGILIFLQKYCVSFFQGKEDSYLETAYSYENKRKELSESIKNNIDRISDIIITYRKGGLTLKLLGMYANDLARRCDCYEAPILFIFADVCQSVRDACANIMRWVELDSGYALFLHNDLVEMQRKRDEYFRKVRDLRERHCQLDHRIRNIQRNIEEIRKQLQRFKGRETVIKDNVIRLKLTIEDLEMELEAREREIKTLRRLARKEAAEKARNTLYSIFNMH